jgi:hypothetical protein
LPKPIVVKPPVIKPYLPKKPVYEPIKDPIYDEPFEDVVVSG